MELIEKKPLLVLNASAGSGKTYNLVRNYLRLLLLEGDNRVEMGHIIAMTFTNKASLEMKHRIVADLNKLAYGDQSTEPYLQDIATFVGLTPALVRKNARIVLKKMLHQYEDFNVLTIDKFNLRLIRSFSRDLNLPEQFEVVMDENSILEKAIDELLSTIDPTQNNQVYRMAINYAKFNLEEGNKWEIKKALIETAAILKDEKSFTTIKELSQTDFSEGDLEEWKNEFNQLLLNFESLKRDLVIAFSAEEIALDDFVGRSRTYNTLIKLCKPPVAKGISNMFAFSTTFEESITKTFLSFPNTQLELRLIACISFWKKNVETLFLLEIKIKQFYLLAILRELALSMEKIREKDAVIRISEFNKLVAELVKDEEAPFIYERLGTRFGHFFLDEFQDTSRLQWSNLVPLVHESLGHGKFNFIVGDPKQSIYRFKNGVAEQFVSLPRIYNPENNSETERKSDFFEKMGTVSGLEDNWRSAKEIVQFNNEFFTALRAKLPENGQKHYNQISQNPKGKEGGWIDILITPKTEDFALREMDYLLEKVAECISDGYQPGDICILSKTKKECNAFANKLKQHGYSVVSSDSLLVSTDQQVQLIISFLKWRTNPLELQYAMFFAQRYFQMRFQQNAHELYESCFDKVEKDGKIRKTFSIDTFLLASHFDGTLLEASYQNLYALIQMYMRSEQLDELNNAYLHQLLDLAFGFDIKNGPDLISFLHFYETSGHASNVILPENKHSIKIMTAHKAKGLEFPVVIMPSLNFAGGKNTNNARILSVNGHFIQSSLTQKEEIIDTLASHKKEEEDAKIMDYINLMYVAFTRPVDRLYLFDKRPIQKSKNKPSEDTILKNTPLLLIDILQKLGKGTVDDQEVFHFTTGQKPALKQNEVETNNQYELVSLKDFLWFPDISIQSAKEEEESSLQKQRRLGKQFHAIMENGATKEEALKALQTGILKGTIESDFAVELENMVCEIFQNDSIVSLFDSGNHLNERSLLLDERTVLRPDKIILNGEKAVVIDFKTGEEKGEHFKQVNDYVFALKEIGYSECSGYLYYAGGKGLIGVTDVFKA